MDYLSQKIKSAPRIGCSLELHKRIMRRALYEQLRYPLLILIGITSIRIAADAWQVINHSLTTVVRSFIESFGLSPYGLTQIILGLLRKALLHPDLIVAIVIDFALVTYVMYMLNLIKKSRSSLEGRYYYNYLTYLNPISLFRYVARIIPYDRKIS